MSSVKTVADALVQAWRQDRPADAAPLESLLNSPEEAYAVQDLVARALGWSDAGLPRHWKSGGPSREAALTHAALPPPRVWTSPADASAVPFHARFIEAEIAL